MQQKQDTEYNMGVTYGLDIVKSGLVLSLDAANKKSFRFRNRIYNYTIWEDGQTGGIGIFGNFSTNNRRVIDLDPWGNDIVVWEGYSIADSLSGSGIYMTTNLQIDNTKMHRMSFWEHRVTNSTATYCRYYFGLNGYGPVNGLYRRDSETIITNTYFYNTSNLPSASQLPVGEWVLMVGHIWPVGSGTGTTHPDSGRYTLSGRLGNISRDYVFIPETERLRSRTLSIYRPDAEGVIHHSAYPRLDVVDGSEPSIDDLLNNRADTVFDLSSNSNHGTLINGLTYKTENNGCLEFDGNNDLIKTKFGNNLNVYDNKITISAWVRSNNTTIQQMWLDTGGNGTDQRLYSGLTTTTRSDFGIGSSDWQDGNPIDTEWHYQTLVLDAGNAIFYDNGVVVQTKSYNSYSLSDNIQFGGRGTIYQWDGDIGIINIYNRALTSDEVFQNYNATKSRYGI